MLEKIILSAAAVLLAASVSSAGNFDLGLSYASGISEKKGVDTSFETKPGPFSFSGGFKYSRQDRNSTQDSLGLNLNYDRHLEGKWTLWLFNLDKYDRVQKINFENSFGGGPKYTFVGTKELELSLSGGIMQDHVDYEGQKSGNLARFSGRFRTRWEITPDMRFAFVNFYQPNLADFSDYLLTATAELSHTISKTVSIKFKSEDAYRSRTKARRHNDLNSTFALSVNF